MSELFPARVIDTGDWTCTVINNQGSDTANMSIIVYCKCVSLINFGQ